MFQRLSPQEKPDLGEGDTDADAGTHEDISASEDQVGKKAWGKLYLEKLVIDIHATECYYSILCVYYVLLLLYIYIFIVHSSFDMGYYGYDSLGDGDIPPFFVIKTARV